VGFFFFFFFFFFNPERYLTESWQILKTPPERKCNTGRNAKKREETRIGQARCVQKSTFLSLNALDMHEEEEEEEEELV
jgi:hypothetical protein